MKTEQLPVSGMTCGGCVSKVSRALTAIVGVDAVNVSLADGIAEVRFDEDRVSTSTVRAAIRAAGYGDVPAPAQTKKGGCCGGS